MQGTPPFIIPAGWAASLDVGQARWKLPSGFPGWIKAPAESIGNHIAYTRRVLGKIRLVCGLSDV